MQTRFNPLFISDVHLGQSRQARCIYVGFLCKTLDSTHCTRLATLFDLQKMTSSSPYFIESHHPPRRRANFSHGKNLAPKVIYYSPVIHDAFCRQYCWAILVWHRHSPQRTS